MKRFIPHNYQAYAIDHVKRNEASGLLLEMGLGKTVSTLSALLDLMYDHFTIARVLVIAPLAVAEHTWPREINKWRHTKDFKFSLVLGTAAKRKKALQEDADIYIINKENLIWLIEQYGKYTNKKNKTGFHLREPWPFDTVVIDELSKFKDPSTKGFKMIKKVRPHMERVIGLTGTPSPNSLIDLWAQIYILDLGERLGRTMTAYKERYFVPASYTRNAAGRLIVTSYELRPGAEEAIYKAIGDICISMKSIDHLDLPEVFHKCIQVNLSDKDKALYLELEKESIIELEGEEVVDAGSAAALGNKLHQLAQGSIYTDTQEKKWQPVHDKKLEAMADIVEEAQGNPILAFYWFKHDLERLKKKFKKARILKTDQDIEDWNAGKIELLLAHPMSAGHGLNLQDGGHLIIWYCLTWSLELYQQANARLNRQGQTKPVTINHLVVEGTIDERIIQVLQGKADQQEALMQAVKAAVTKHRK